MNKYHSNDFIANKVVQQLDDSITGLDEDIKQSLSASRKAALAKATEHSDQSFFNVNWKQSAALAAVLIIVVTAGITLFSTDSETLFGESNMAFLNTDVDVTDDAVIAEFDLLNELEFITWLIEDNDDENNAS